MAAPGSPLDPRARGSNSLIKQGAILVESAEDVMAALDVLSAGPRRPISAGPLFDEAPPPIPPGLGKKIAALLSPTPIHINDLARLVGAPAGAVAAALMELELDGAAASLPGGFAATSGAGFAGLG
jgi:DNA processing protein